MARGAADPVTVQVDHELTWHAASSSLELDQYPDAGESYTVTSDHGPARRPTPAPVATADTSPDSMLLKLPPRSVLRRCQGPRLDRRPLDNDYDKVMAIWQHLAHGEFHYRVDVPYQDDAQSLADFLVKKQGFCQQFASLMAVMLRELGIPARVAFGFNQGTALGDGVYSIRTRNLHSWVEVPFQGYGWLGFDPTPGLFRSGRNLDAEVVRASRSRAPGRSKAVPTRGHPARDTAAVGTTSRAAG